MALDSLTQDTSLIDPYEWVYKCFGGAGSPYRFKIDEILVTSAWRPNFSIAERYLSQDGKVVLVGDAAHRNPPHGGYGMNSGLEDALAVSWRLSALIKGYGGPHLLSSYEDEQRPIMLRRLQRCNHHVGEHLPRYQIYGEKGPEVLLSETDDGIAMRNEIKDYLDKSGSECLDRGIELDVRYKSAVICHDENGDAKEPAWDMKKYTPSTYPGARAPHVFLKGGKTSILDTYGPEFTLIVFTSCSARRRGDIFAKVAKELGMQLKIVELVDEEHARAIWGHDFVMVRADGHVPWRGQEVPHQEKVREILRVVTGQKEFEGYVPAEAQPGDTDWLEMLQQDYNEVEQLGVGDQV